MSLAHLRRLASLPHMEYTCDRHLSSGCYTPQERAQQAAEQLAALEQEMQQMQLAQVGQTCAWVSC